MKLGLILRCALACLSVCATAKAAIPAFSPFQTALPVWPEGKETERNLLVEFRATFERPDDQLVTVRLAASTLYRVYVNGQFQGHGPARAGHGFYRVDEWNVTDKLQAGRNEIVIEVAGYNINSFYLLDQPSFLQAEVIAGNKVVAATGDTGFSASIRHDRVQKVQRYSFQRTFSEVWRLPSAPEPVQCVICAAKPLALRRVPYPRFDVRRPVAHVAAGSVQRQQPPERLWKDRSLTAIGPNLKGFQENELECIPSIELQGVRTVSSGSAGSNIALPSNTFHIVDFGTDTTGFIGARVTVSEKTRLFITFDEILSNGDVDWRRLSCVNILAYELQPGKYSIESFEPYTLRFAKLIVLDGNCDVTDLYVREYANPEAGRATFVSSDARINRVFEAARETFRQNATDVFMDCPSRERAGWLCDSFFTARVAQDLCGNSTVEKNFFENFQRATHFPRIPEGMLPMCYPGDQYDGSFIPNWAMWFVLQLEEYAERTGDRDLTEALRPRVMRLLEFFRKYENSDGLLEKLPGWVFVEWSKANDFVRDVNYPSNMLYAGMIDAASRLYQLPELTIKAAHLREVIRHQSFDGEFFVDNAIRKDGLLRITRNRSEICQYFAFFFGVATPERDPALWKTLVSGFGPKRKQTKAYPEIHPANAFIGNQMRFELLSQAGRSQQILDEAADYWLYMVERTGTLWENDDPQASCNHGFASHAAHVLLRDVLGLRKVDLATKSLHVRLADLSLDSCRGSILTPDGPIDLAWKKEQHTLSYRLKSPAGYKVTVENASGRPLLQRRADEP